MIKLVFTTAFLLVLIGCNSISQSFSPNYTIGGNITGLTGTGMVLQNNLGDNITIPANATNFTFPTSMTSENNYSVTILTNPTGQACALTNFSGTITSVNVTSVSINCIATNLVKKIFLTASINNGNLGSITGADALCMFDQENPKDGQYKAMLVDDAGTRVACKTANCETNNEGVDWVLQPNTIYVRATDNVIIGRTNAAAIFAFPLNNALFPSAQDNPGVTLYWWTGLTEDWTTNQGSTCSNWSIITGNTSVGVQGAQDSNSIYASSPRNNALCPAFNGLLCVEQ